MKHHRLLPLVALVAAGAAMAQATVKPDGRFRAAVGLGASLSTGNSRNTSLSFAADAVRATEGDKSSLFATALYNRSAGVTTSEKMRLGGRHDHDMTPRLFVFGALEFERNKFANLQLRSQVAAGAGFHAVKTERLRWDLFGGVGYTKDDFKDPMLIDGAVRDSYGYANLLLAEESTHQLTGTTSAKQRFAFMPNLKNSGEYRATWDAGLAVAMSTALNLNVGLGVSYNSEPGPGRKSTDTLLTTGISMKFD